MERRGWEGNWQTGGRWSDLDGVTWLRESWGAKKCDGNERWGMGSGRRVKGMMGCWVGWGGMGRGKNGVRNHFGRHFTNIVYIIKKMF